MNNTKTPYINITDYPIEKCLINTKAGKYFKRFYHSLILKYQFANKPKIYSGLIACIMYFAEHEDLSILDEVINTLTRKVVLGADYLKFSNCMLYTSEFNERELDLNLMDLADRFIKYCKVYGETSNKVSREDFINALKLELEQFVNAHKNEVNSDDISLEEYLELKLLYAIHKNLTEHKMHIAGIGIMI